MLSCVTHVSMNLNGVNLSPRAPLHVSRRCPARICLGNLQQKRIILRSGTRSISNRAPALGGCPPRHKGRAHCTAHAAVALAAWLAINSWVAPAACALDLPSASRLFPVSGPASAVSVTQSNVDGNNGKKDAIEGLLSDAIAYVNGMLSYSWIFVAIEVCYVAAMASHPG